MACSRLVLGVDGGGTKTEAWLAEVSGAGDPTVIGRGLAASSNPRAVGMDVACTNLGLVIDAAFADAKRAIQSVDVVVLALSGANGTGKVSFATEGGLFAQSGIPTVICGPGSIEQAHKPNEFLALDQLRLCEDFLDRLVKRVRR